MSLDYELTKFKRNDIAIVSRLSSLLKTSPVLLSEYAKSHEEVNICCGEFLNQLSCLGITDDKLLVFSLTELKKDVLVVLPVSVESFMKSSTDYKESSLYDDIGLSFLRLNDGSSTFKKVVLFLNYDRFCLQYTKFKEVWFDYKYFGYIYKFIELNANPRLYEFISHGRYGNLAIEHLLYGDGFEYVRNKILEEIKLTTNKDYIDDLYLSLQFLDEYLECRDDNELAQLAMFACSDINFRRLDLVNSHDYINTRGRRLQNWKKVLTEDRDIISIEYTGYFAPLLDNESFKVTNIATPKNLSINIVKDLPKLLLFVYSIHNDLDDDNSIPLCIADYISTDSSKFRRPYDLYEGKYYADGNLSKARAVKKFISAVEKLGLNLSDFKIVIE